MMGACNAKQPDVWKKHAASRTYSEHTEQRNATLLAVKGCLMRHFVSPSEYPGDRFDAPHSEPQICDMCCDESQQNVQYCGNCLFRHVVRPAIIDSFRNPHLFHFDNEL